jgi:hypothetical protein
VKPSALKREHPALQNNKFLIFFLFLWIIFVPQDPNPDPKQTSAFSKSTGIVSNSLPQVIATHYLNGTYKGMRSKGRLIHKPAAK